MQNLKSNLLNFLRVHGRSLGVLYATFGIYFFRIFQHMLVRKAEGLYAGHPHAWSDWALHISLTNIFALKEPAEWFAYHPYFAGGKLTYGFLTHLISGLLMRMGLSIESASIYPSIVLIYIFIAGLYFLGFAITKSQKTAALAVFLVMFSSGASGVAFVQDFYAASDKTAMILYPPKDYSRMEDRQWFAGNIPAAILVPQRAFLIGAAIGTWALYCFYAGLQAKDKQQQKKLLLLGGLLAGVLPIAHMHSFIALVVISGTASVLQYRKSALLLWYVVPAALFSIPLYLHFVHGGIQINDFFTWKPGFTADPTFFSWLQLWWNIWGMTIPVAIAGIVLIRKTPKIAHTTSFFAGFFALFVLANCIMFQPTFWDNSKLFTWVYFGFAILIAHYLVKLHETRNIFRVISMWLLLFLLTFTGALELIRLQNFDRNTHLLSTTTEMQLAKKIRESTDSDALFLIAPIHNHPVNMWAARSIFLGYPGWIRNFGFDYYHREEEMRAIYEGQPQAKAILQKNNIDFVYVGDQERYLLLVNDAFFAQFPIFAQNEHAIVYDVRRL